MSPNDPRTLDTLRLYDDYGHREKAELYLQPNAHTRDKLRNIERLVQAAPGEEIVELGYSSGKSSIHFARAGANVKAVDFDPMALEAANWLLTRVGPLRGNLSFEVADATAVEYGPEVNKILMLDFTEHIEDQTFAQILANIREQAPTVPVYIYTPNAWHWLELLKRLGALKQEPTHINVKGIPGLRSFLRRHHFAIEREFWVPTHLVGLRIVDRVFGAIPLVGLLFRRRVAIVARVRN